MSVSSLDDLERAARAQIAEAPDGAALDAVRVALFGKKGEVTERLKALGGLDPESRKVQGAALNVLKTSLLQTLAERAAALEEIALAVRLTRESVDVTLPARTRTEGRLHPIPRTIETIVAAFASLGFHVAEGPDIEDDWTNFTALNIPPDHPARDMQATFHLPPRPDGTPMVLRTHTSPVQIRTMRRQAPPLRILTPGRVFRRDYDMTHTPMFHQIEGLVIEPGIHMGHLKGCLMTFLRTFFGRADLPVRFRPSYFPFTEPSAEVDIGCTRSKGELKLGHVGQGEQDWLEVLGCGMVHPNVLHHGGLDPERTQGFAFGMGVERLAMLREGIPDLRTFFEGDTRWLRHYGTGVFEGA